MRYDIEEELSIPENSNLGEIVESFRLFCASILELSSTSLDCHHIRVGTFVAMLVAAGGCRRGQGVQGPRPSSKFIGTPMSCDQVEFLELSFFQDS